VPNSEKNLKASGNEVSSKNNESGCKPAEEQTRQTSAQHQVQPKPNQHGKERQGCTQSQQHQRQESKATQPPQKPVREEQQANPQAEGEGELDSNGFRRNYFEQQMNTVSHADEEDNQNASEDEERGEDSPKQHKSTLHAIVPRKPMQLISNESTRSASRPKDPWTNPQLQHDQQPTLQGRHQQSHGEAHALATPLQHPQELPQSSAVAYLQDPPAAFAHVAPAHAHQGSHASSQPPSYGSQHHAVVGHVYQDQDNEQYVPIRGQIQYEAGSPHPTASSSAGRPPQAYVVPPNHGQFPLQVPVGVSPTNSYPVYGRQPANPPQPQDPYARNYQGPYGHQDGELKENVHAQPRVEIHGQFSSLEQLNKQHMGQLEGYNHADPQQEYLQLEKQTFSHHQHQHQHQQRQHQHQQQKQQQQQQEPQQPQ
jgi:hypothetical protein